MTEALHLSFYSHVARTLAGNFFLAAALLNGAAAEPPQHLTLLTEDGPPFNMPGKSPGEITGMSTDLLKIALDRAGIGFSITLLPWARALKLAESQAGTCVYSTNMTDERKPLLKWVGPFYDNKWVVIGRAGTTPLARLDDVRGHVIGGYYDDATTEFLEQNGYQVQKATDDTLNIRMLQAGRVDYWVAGRLRAQYMMRQTAATDLVELLELRSAELYLACNGSVPDETIRKLNVIIEGLRRDGTEERIAQQYR